MPRQQGGSDEGKENVLMAAFNRGLISALGLARTDFKRTALSSTIQTNWMPRLLGSMMLRPGTFCVDRTNGNVSAIHIPFIYSSTDTAIIQMTPGNMTVLVNETAISRVAVGTAITNGTFVGNISGWTNADSGSALSQYAATNLMQLTGDGTNFAAEYQAVTIAPADQGNVHGLRVVVQYADTVTGGDVQIMIGTTIGGSDLVPVSNLRTGTYSFAFTPNTGTVYVQVQSNQTYSCYVSQITIEPAGVMTLPTPYGASDLFNIRSEQSADIVWLACQNFQMLRIERHETYGWGISNYMPPDGPMLLPNITPTTLTPSAISGDITVTSSQPIFVSGHVGAVFSLTSVGQLVTGSIAAQNTFTQPIQVTGVGAQRNFTINISGTFSGTVTLQYSVGAIGSWVDQGSSWTSPVATSLSDGFDNSIIFYRLGIETGNYSSGTAVCSLSFPTGDITGIFRIKSLVSTTEVNASVLTPLGGTTASNVWSEGQWSTYRGFPSCVVLYGGRLFWAGGDNVNGSISNAYESFNIAQVGDSGPILQGIGSGPIDVINWMLPMVWLVLGGQGAEHTVKTSVIDTPITPSNFIIRPPSNVGSTNVAAVKKDLEGFFVSHNGTRLFKLSLQNAYYSFDYDPTDMTVFMPEMLDAGVVRMAMQRFPDVRFHCVLKDGTAAVLVYDRTEEVQAWVVTQMNTAIGQFDKIVDVMVMPNPSGTEDYVYYTVQRTNGFFLERWAMESECVGGTLNKNLDCHVIYNGAATSLLPLTITTPTGTFYPFAGLTVQVWGNGANLGTFAIPAGTQATLDISNAVAGTTTTVTSAVVGIPYPAAYQSSKLAYAVPGGTALCQRKEIAHLGVIAQNMHPLALYYGNKNDMAAVMAGTTTLAGSNMQMMPGIEYDAIVNPNIVWPTYDNDMFEFPGEHDTDSRLCLYTPGGLPVTLLATVIDIGGAPTI